MLRNFFHQKRTPVFTAISLVVTVGVAVVIVMLALEGHDVRGATAQRAATIDVVTRGTLANVVVGIIASVRGEHWGGRVAGCGIALWSLIVIVLACFDCYV